MSSSAFRQLFTKTTQHRSVQQDTTQNRVHREEKKIKQRVLCVTSVFSIAGAKLKDQQQDKHKHE